MSPPTRVGRVDRTKLASILWRFLSHSRDERRLTREQHRLEFERLNLAARAHAVAGPWHADAVKLLEPSPAIDVGSRVFVAHNDGISVGSVMARVADDLVIDARYIVQLDGEIHGRQHAYTADRVWAL